MRLLSCTRLFLGRAPFERFTLKFQHSSIQKSLAVSYFRRQPPWARGLAWCLRCDGASASFSVLSIRPSTETTVNCPASHSQMIRANGASSRRIFNPTPFGSALHYHGTRFHTVEGNYLTLLYCMDFLFVICNPCDTHKHTHKERERENTNKTMYWVK